MRAEMWRSVRLGLALVWMGCVATEPVPDIQPGERTFLDRDEADLWFQVDRVEANLRSSGSVVTDPVLNAYVKGVVCRLTPDHCDDIRVYIVQAPYFNASMAPNGMMEVWTGLLLRAENEAQLATVLGHEIAHYKKRHSLQNWRDIRSKTDALAFMEALAEAADVGYSDVRRLVGAAVIASIYRFSRGQEREADRLGFDLMARAGYDPGQAPRLWKGQIEEKKAGNDPEPPIFLSSHPADEERLATLTAMAESSRSDETPLTTGRARYLEHVLPSRAEFLEDELRQRRFDRSLFTLERLRASDAAPGEVEFFLGELYRESGKPGGEVKALSHYERAVELEGAPPETYRSLGWIHRRLGNEPEARTAFRRYLELAPQAKDRLMIESYLIAPE